MDHSSRKSVFAVAVGVAVGAGTGAGNATVVAVVTAAAMEADRAYILLGFESSIAVVPKNLA